MCERREEWIATFGFSSPLKNHFIRIKGNRTRPEATKEMNRQFGNRWSMLYATEAEAGVEEYGLKEIK
jgi:hypothetical protein